MKRLSRILLLAGVARSSLAVGDTFAVINTNDSGAGSLRQAILDANANSGADTIAFAIPGSGVHVIAPASGLPDVTGAVTIDGYTQPGSLPNTHGPGLPDNSVHLVVLDGTNAGNNAHGIRIYQGGGGSTIRGLVVRSFAAQGIVLENTGGNNVVEGCFLGTDASGTAAFGNGSGVHMLDDGSGEANDIIGGTTPAARNVISGNLGDGIVTGAGGGGSGHQIQGNFVGLDATGAAALGNGGNGIDLAFFTGDAVIGGTTPAARNVIAGQTASNRSGINLGSGVHGTTVEGNYIGTDVTGAVPIPNNFGISLSDSANTVGGSAAGTGNVVAASLGPGIIVNSSETIQGNLIGTDATGLVAMGNGGTGVYIYGSGNLIGGTGPGEGNVVANNGASDPTGGGVLLLGAGRVDNAIRGNSIYANTSNGTVANRGLGIDLDGDGPSPNDPGDADGGGNLGQNYPVIATVTILAPLSGTRIQGRFNSIASTVFDLDFFFNPPCTAHPHDFFQGKTYVGSTQVTTDGSGNATFDVTFTPTIQLGEEVTATATDPSGNTSEFSHRLVFSASPPSGIPAGGTSVTLSGTDFLAGATLTIGGQPATDVLVSSSTTITATTPALPPGTANILVVANTDATVGALSKGWVSDFLDVPGGNQFYSYVTILVENGITAGIGGGLYGVGDDTLRQQMAVFLLKAEHGLCYAPPPCVGTFPDVPCPSTFADWIEAMAAEGITGGCGGGAFCPQNPVRRDQMAVFLLKAEHGPSYAPPACVGTFMDVPCPSPFADWIEELSAEGITGGCGGGNYCPSASNTRGQMAVFIVKTFHLQ